MHKICATFAVLMTIGCAAQDDESVADSTTEPAAVSVRVQFVPGSEPTSGLERSKGAVWTSLAPWHVGRSDKLYLQAHAGIGDQFPVMLEDDTKLFDILLVYGNDDAVSLEVISEQGTESIELDRDEYAIVTIGGVDYTIRYPTVHAASTEPASSKTTNKALITVSAPK